MRAPAACICWRAFSLPSGVIDRVAFSIRATSNPSLSPSRTVASTHTSSSEAARFGLSLNRLTPKFAGQLSGGEQQIFALLCALGGRYDVLLLDEFTSHMDEQSEAVAFDLLTSALATEKIGVVLVSHKPIPLTIDETIEMEGYLE